MDVQALEHRLTVIEGDVKSMVRLGEQNAQVSGQILTQARETNGRVKKLEEWKLEKEAYDRGRRDILREIKRRDLFFLSIASGALALIAPKITDFIWLWITQMIGQ